MQLGNNKYSQRLSQETMIDNSCQNTNFQMMYDAKNCKEFPTHPSKTPATDSVKRVFDKLSKSYILESKSSATRISFPIQLDKKQLSLSRQYLVLKVLPEQNFGIQFSIIDNNKTTRRVVISSNTKQPTQIKLFAIKIASQQYQKGWGFILIDLWSFMEGFPGQGYDSLQQVVLFGAFQLKYIFNTSHSIADPQKIKRINCPKIFKTILEDVNNLYTYSFQKALSKVSKPKPKVLETIQNTPKQREYRIRRGTLTRSRQKEPVTSYLQKDQSVENIKGTIENKPLRTPSMKITSKYEEIGLNCGGLFRNRNKSKLAVELRNKSQIRKKSGTIEVVPEFGSQKKSLLINLGSRDRLSLVRYERSRMRMKKKSIDTSHQSSTLAVSEYIRDPSVISNEIKNRERNNSFGRKLIPGRSIYSDSQYLEMSQKFSTITHQNFYKSEYHKKAGVQKEIKYQESINQEIEEVPENERTTQVQCQISEKFNSPADSQNKSKKSEAENEDNFEERHYKEFVGCIQRPYSPSYDQISPPKQPLPLISQFPSHPSAKKVSQIQAIYDPILKCYYDFKNQVYYQLKH